MRLFMAVVVAVLALALGITLSAAGCTNGDSCKDPNVITYSCPDAQTQDAGVCVGGPRYPGVVADGRSHAAGCVATLPACSPYYPSTRQTCTCFTSDPSNQPLDGGLWSCPM